MHDQELNEPQFEIPFSHIAVAFFFIGTFFAALALVWLWKKGPVISAFPPCMFQQSVSAEFAPLLNAKLRKPFSSVPCSLCRNFFCRIFCRKKEGRTLKRNGMNSVFFPIAIMPAERNTIGNKSQQTKRKKNKKNGTRHTFQRFIRKWICEQSRCQRHYQQYKGPPDHFISV